VCECDLEISMLWVILVGVSTVSNYGISKNGAFVVMLVQSIGKYADSISIYEEEFEVKDGEKE
jgi:hypothetical protein